VEPWREVVPPGPIYADKLNALAAEVARLSKLLGDGIDVEHGPANVTLTVPRPRERHVVKVYADEDSPADGCTTQAYRWVRQTPAACGVEGDETPTPVTGGVSTNNPAYLPNGGTIPDGTVVEIVPGAAYLDGGGNVVQEWIILQGGGGTANVKKVIITSWQCKDDPSKTTCNGTGPSPHCYYPGKLQTLTCAGWTDGANVWVVFTLENLLTPVPSIGGGAPPTLVVIGSRVEAADEGFSYAPDNMGSPAVHPNNGESRPVWSSDFYAALVGIGCGPPLGGPLGGES
jgi:hypothetical protein